MSVRRILVTGGAGYIGSHACKSLARAGFEPVAYDNLVYGHRWAVQWGPLEVGDIADHERLVGVLEQYRPEAVIHFAAFAYVGESVQDPAKYYRNNVCGSVALLEAMRTADIRRIVCSSTCATYGVPRQVPIPDSHPQDPINPYGWSKRMIEQALRDYAQAYEFSCCALRYFNAAGADPDGETGEVHDPETHLIPNVLKAATGELEHVSIFGDDYDTPDGTCIRDYIHVSDLADAHVLALAALEAPGFSAYNLGTETGHSVTEIIDAAEAIVGRPIPKRSAPRRAGDPPRLVADARRAKRELGWSPKWAGIEDVVGTAWRWESERKPELTGK